MPWPCTQHETVSYQNERWISQKNVCKRNESKLSKEMRHIFHQKLSNGLASKT